MADTMRAVEHLLSGERAADAPEAWLSRVFATLADGVSQNQR